MKLNHGILSQFTVFICVLFVLPTAHPVNQTNMNYAIVSVGGIFLIVGFTWLFWGRHRFTGPVHTNPDLATTFEDPSSQLEKTVTM